MTYSPCGTTYGSVNDTHLKANDKGKCKTKKVEDTTTDKVEISIHLAPRTSPDMTIDALYAFTDCEVSISPNSCVIENDKPVFIRVDELLRISTEHTKDLIRQDLAIQLGELHTQWFFTSLEQLLLENRTYRYNEDTETW